jgi:multicomponent Na+:H+ antiporter subunit D
MIFPFIAVPLILASVMPLIGRFSKRFLPDALANLAFLFLLVYSLITMRQLSATGPAIHQLLFLKQVLNINMVIDGFSAFMLFTISLVTLCAGLFSINYMEHYGAKANYYALLLIMVAGMNGLVLANDLFQVYLFLEVAAVASYGLVAFGLGLDELEASYKYLMLSAVSSGFILISIAVIFSLTGSLNFGQVAAGLQALNMKYAVGLCAGFFILGFGLKSALVPFHAWLPDAHPSAPAPISAMLSGLLIKVSGVYALARIFFNVFGLNPALSQVLMYAGVISLVVGAVIALGQNDIKRMLAYSSISQVGYIILGIGLGTPLGILGGLFHLFNHAIAKGLLFLNSGSIQNATGTRSLDRLGGLAKRMPLTAATTLIGSLSIAGVPPLAGFWSKLIIIIALFQARQYGFALIAVLTSIVTLWYYLLIQRAAFFGKLNETWKNIKEAPFWMSASTVILGLICIAVGIFFGVVIRSWIQPAADALSAGVIYGFKMMGF